MSDDPPGDTDRRRGTTVLGRRANGPFRAIRRALAVGCLVVVAGVPARPVPASPAPTTLWVAQMNLCNSGRAACYTGRAVPRAAELIRTERPDLVTLNEICQDDVPTLEAVFATVHGRARVTSAFQAAGDRPSSADTRCRNGRAYGIGLLARLPTTASRYTVHSGIHPAQDLADPEERPWLCVHVEGGLNACTTHLAATSRSVALAQCGQLIDGILPAIRRRTGYAPTVLSGDLNLRPGDVGTCVPPGHPRVGDGAVQHIVASDDISLCCARSVDMDGATDHPALLATLVVGCARPAGQSSSSSGSRSCS
ncbi:endonuclease/exonuclease/phosphatase family protein [Micromonospora sp. NPDC005174]|uniref:endonuclease/exonuclease/phosphatase family protein n=1 Tax=Micromonospora sp. NPDC005174 TaxID=3157018 RepID=UPI0033A0A044